MVAETTCACAVIVRVNRLRARPDRLWAAAIHTSTLRTVSAPCVFYGPPADGSYLPTLLPPTSSTEASDPDQMSVRTKPSEARCAWRREDGASAVEFAIVSSILFFLLLAILQIGWALQVRNHLAQAADRGVRYIVLNPTASDSTIQTYVRNLVPDYPAQNLTVTSATEVAGTISYKVIRVSYSFTLRGLPVQLVTLNVSRRTPT